MSSEVRNDPKSPEYRGFCTEKSGMYRNRSENEPKARFSFSTLNPALREFRRYMPRSPEWGLGFRNSGLFSGLSASLLSQRSFLVPRTQPLFWRGHHINEGYEREPTVKTLFQKSPCHLELLESSLEVMQVMCYHAYTHEFDSEGSGAHTT